MIWQRQYEGRTKGITLDMDVAHLQTFVFSSHDLFKVILGSNPLTEDKETYAYFHEVLSHRFRILNKFLTFHLGNLHNRHLTIVRYYDETDATDERNRGINKPLDTAIEVVDDDATMPHRVFVRHHLSQRAMNLPIAADYKVGNYVKMLSIANERYCKARPAFGANLLMAQHGISQVAVDEGRVWPRFSRDFGDNVGSFVLDSSLLVGNKLPDALSKVLRQGGAGALRPLLPSSARDVFARRRRGTHEGMDDYDDFLTADKERRLRRSQPAIRRRAVEEEEQQEEEHETTEEEEAADLIGDNAEEGRDSDDDEENEYDENPRTSDEGVELRPCTRLATRLSQNSKKSGLDNTNNETGTHYGPEGAYGVNYDDADQMSGGETSDDSELEFEHLPDLRTNQEKHSK